MSEDESKHEGGNPDPNSSSPVPSRPVEIEGAKYERENSERQQNERQKQAADFISSAERTADAVKIAAIANILAALAAIGAVVVGIAQCSFNKAQVVEMRAQLKVMERAQTDATLANVEQNNRSELEQRAWINLVQADLDGPLDFSREMKVTTFVENFGKTPAKNVRVRLVGIYSTDFPLPDSYQLPEFASEDSRGILVPGVKYPASTKINFNLLKPSDLADFLERAKTQKVYFYCVGMIEYLDVFSKPHTTTFCGYRSNRDGLDIELSLAPTRNEMR